MALLNEFKNSNWTLLRLTILVSHVSIILLYNLSKSMSTMMRATSMTNNKALISLQNKGLSSYSISYFRTIGSDSRSFRHLSTTTLFARRKAIEVSNSSSWTTVSFSTEAERQKIDMQDRIDDAERWVSKQLSDSEVEVLNRALGIDGDLLERESEKESKYKKLAKNNKSKKNGDIDLQLDLPAMGGKPFNGKFLEERVKGFLELNPQLCSGCGTSFQTKNPDSPGYLQPDKFHEHKINAKRIREKQEAIKILDMAGIDVDSAAAEEILVAANISKDIIEGVKALKGNDRFREKRDALLAKEQDDLEEKEERRQEQEDLRKNILINDIDHEVNPSSNFMGENAQKKQKPMRYPGWDKYDPLSEEEIASHLKGVAPGAISYDQFKELKDAKDILSESICVCQRCFRLQAHGTVEETLRPGWSTNELLTPERFESLLQDIKNQDAVVLCIVDLFDIQGSLLPNLRAIAGKNPIMIAANKFDLLPKDVSEPRLKQWIYDQVRISCGMKTVRELDDDQQRRYRMIQNNPDQGFIKKVDESGVLKHNNIHLVSCEAGTGMNNLINSVMEEAGKNGNKVYVMGAANVGKSSFVNLLLQNSYGNTFPKKGKPSKKVQPRQKDIPRATVSNIPGTTLDFIKIRMPNGITMIDTPGLINKGILTSRLTSGELKKVIPRTPINAVTFLVPEEKAILLGGLATVELVQGRPFYLSFFLSNEIKIHATNTSKVNTFIEKHIGSLVFPPETIERWRELGPFESHEFEVRGDSWEKASADIVVSGLGWIAVTGPGVARIKVTVPQGILVQLRNNPILPFEAKWTTARFSGGRIIKKSRKEDNYGWRA